MWRQYKWGKKGEINACLVLANQEIFLFHCWKARIIVLRSCRKIAYAIYCTSPARLHRNFNMPIPFIPDDTKTPNNIPMKLWSDVRTSQNTQTFYDFLECILWSSQGCPMVVFTKLGDFLRCCCISINCLHRCLLLLFIYLTCLMFNSLHAKAWAHNIIT